MSVGVVTEKDFSRQPNSDIGAQLWNVPGVQMGGANVPGDRRILIRGHSAGATLILIDGVKQPEIRNTAGAGLTIGNSDIERIEVIKGPSSVLYGSDAVGGVINIITKKGGPNPIGGSLSFIYDGSIDSLAPRAAIFGSNKGFYYRLSGSGLNADDRRVPGETLFNSNYRQRNYRGHIGYEWDKGSVQFTVDHFESLNNYVPVEIKPHGRQGPANLNTFTGLVSEVPDNDRDAYVLNFNLNNLSDNLVDLKFMVYYQELFKTFQYYNYISKLYTNKHKYTHDAYGGSIQSDWRFFDDHYVTFGIEYDNIKMGKYDHNLQNGTHALSEGGQKTWALYLQDEWTIVPAFTLTAGLRQSNVELFLDRETARPDRVGTKKYSNVVGSLGMVFRVNEELALRAIFSQGYKVPNITQMMIGTGIIIPNMRLKPETSNNYEIGARYNSGNLNVDAAIFYNIFKDGIINETVQLNPLVVQAKNVSEIKSYGAELGADYSFSNTGFGIYGNVNVLVFETQDDNGFKTKRNSRSPGWGTLGLTYEDDFWDEMTWFADLNAMKGVGSYSLRASGLVEHRTDSWEIANFTIGVTGGEKIKRHLTISLRNIFDRWYQVASPFSPSSPLPEAGFHVVVAAGVEF
jgi:hemoglobin/transferrin/lactoferrin receptor protein